MTPAAAIDHLLIRKHRCALWTPIHFALLAVGESLLVELEEEPLVPLVIFRKAGRDLARPVVGKAKALHLRLHVGDVAQRPLTWRRVRGNGRVLRRQSKRIPAHGMENVVAVHPHVAGKRVPNGVVAHVPHMQSPGRIRQHLKHVVLWLGGIHLRGIKRRIVLPALEPLFFDFVRVVALVFSAFAIAGHSCFLFLRHRS